MRYRRPRRRQTRTKTIIMTGGLNEAVTDLELKEGELHQCLNYTEMDGPYHGYVSIAGYEVFDGKSSPSSIRAPFLLDNGNDSETILLLEAPTGNTDQSDAAQSIVGTEVYTTEAPTQFEDGSFELSNTYFRVKSTFGGSFNEEFDQQAFDTNVDVSSMNLGFNWTIDFFIKPKAFGGSTIIFDKAGCYRFTLQDSGLCQFQISEDGMSFSGLLDSGVQTVLANKFYHVSITSRNKTVRMAVDGIMCRDISDNIKEISYTQIHQNEADLFIGSDYTLSQLYLGYLDEFRLSTNYRWTDDFQVPTQRYSYAGYSVPNWDDLDREAQRNKITEVPGEGPVLGVHIYQGELYALRNAVGGATAAIYRANRISDGSGGYTDASGWVLIDGTLNPGGRMNATNWRFSGSFNDQQVMCIVDGASVPRIWDGTTMTILDGLYAAGVASNLPDNQGSPRYAKLVSIFDNRLLLGYELDDIFLSSKFDPGDFSGGFGSQLLIGDDITNFRELPGEAMAIFCRNSIKVLEKLEVPTSAADTPDYTFRVQNFSRQAGALPWTCERVLQNILYADDRGVVNFADTDKAGDFGAAAVSKKVNRVYLAKKSIVTTSLVDKEVNQYRLFFSDGSSLWFTFHEDGLKGATFVEYPDAVTIACEGEDSSGNIIKFFASTDGFVYQMDSGTSFNGEEIVTEMFSAFYHYASPRYWKDFMRVVFEVTASRGTTLRTRTVFDYDDSSFPETLWWEQLVSGQGGVWGKDYWNEFVWGASAVQRVVGYIRGHGTNMSLEVRTQSKFTQPHIIHNAIVDYQMEDPQQ